MSRIAFFCIPAHGHTNPTLGVVRELTRRGNEVCYFSYLPFKEEIEAAGAEFVSCDDYDIQLKLTSEDAAKVATDIGLSVKLLVNTTLALDEMVCSKLRSFKPDCVVADSMAIWGKFAAQKLALPFISSTTTFAFNRHSAKLMKQSPAQGLAFLKALPGAQKDIKRLRAQGYPVKNVLSILANDNDTETIVYTSKEFQPCAETFSEKYSFVGPCVKAPAPNDQAYAKDSIYISLGTVNNRMPDFYRNCIEALKSSDAPVIMSVGEGTDIASLGELPANFTVQKRVEQTAVLQDARVFLSHCGMNSVNESLYYGVPLVLFPQTPEQGSVALRVAQLQAGDYLEENSVEAIRKAVDTVLSNAAYKENAAAIAETFKRAGGASAAADVIEERIKA